MSCTNANISGTVNASGGSFNGTITSDNASIRGRVEATSGKIGNMSIADDGCLTTRTGDGAFYNLSQSSLAFSKKSGDSVWSLATIGIYDSNSYINFIRTDGNSSRLLVQTVEAETYGNLSKESLKENFELYQNALNVIKNSEIYRYNYKNKTEKKIGFVIPDLGGKFKTPSEVMTSDKQSIDMYVMSSIMWKAIQELTTKVEELENTIKEMEENNG